MLERIIVQLLEQARDELTAKPALIEELFYEHLGATRELARAIRTWWVTESKWATDPRTGLQQRVLVSQQYARAQGPFPVWIVTLGQEKESQRYLGDVSGFMVGANEEPMVFGPSSPEPLETAVPAGLQKRLAELDMEADEFISENPELAPPATGLDRTVVGAGAEEVGSDWTKNYTVMCVSENADETLWIYQLAKYVLVSHRGTLINQAPIEDLEFGGSPNNPDPRYQPTHCFIRSLTLTAMAEELRIGPQVPRVFRVQGVGVDASEEEPSVPKKTRVVVP